MRSTASTNAEYADGSWMKDVEIHHNEGRTGDAVSEARTSKLVMEFSQTENAEALGIRIPSKCGFVQQKVIKT